ncbi:hypothetical protein SOPP22_14975 [Shewanella sp. OPT22]|nr:hypothetical protein SOPP22_14975 [Shewanella sp. OPT22]
MKISVRTMFALSILVPMTVFANERHEKKEIHWESNGYGFVLKDDGDKITFYDVTKKHCLINKRKSEFYSQHKIERTNESQALFEIGAVHKLKLNKLDRLPELCVNPIKRQGDKGYKFNAVQVFDIFWQTFDEHFAFNPLIKWDWRSEYSQWKAKVHSNTTEAELLAILDEFLFKLDDGHASIEDQDDDRISYHNSRDLAFSQRAESDFKNQTEHKSLRDYHDYQLSKSIENTAKYFDSTYKIRKLSWNVLFAQLPRKLSYLRIDDMYDFSKDETADSDVESVNKMMNRIMPEISNSKGVIIDLRWNGGGEDLVSKQFLSYFIGKQLNSGSKKYKRLNGFSKPKNIIIEPNVQNPFLGNVVVLTSQLTSSAAEAFLIYMKARGNVTFIGENTNGILSDMLVKELPNGWSLTLSNEQYFDIEGNIFEFVGFPVSKHFEYFNAQDLEKGIDPALEEAMKILTKL